MKRSPMSPTAIPIPTITRVERNIQPRILVTVKAAALDFASDLAAFGQISKT